jgi:integrase
MFKERSRERFLQPDEINRFFAALYEDPNELFRNYVLLSLFIGLRRQNMLSMRWSCVDLTLGIVSFPDSKNGEPQRIPLITQAWDILKEMRKHATDDWVFPSQNGSKSGHVEDLHRPWYALLKRAGIENMRFHDLRRTFGSYQAITGAGSFVLGKALGDKTNAAVRVYARLTMDPIRDSIQRGADKMLEFIRPGQ